MKQTLFAAAAAFAMIAAPMAANAQANPPAQAPAAQGQQFLPGIFGCQATGGKQEVGAVLGGALGGLAGNRISKENRTLGTVIGAVVGAGVGSWVGCRMQKGDQERAQAAAEKAIAEGRNQTWSNPETGASGRVTVVGEGGGMNPMDGVKFAPGVSLASSYAGASGMFVANSAANIRSAPNTKGRIVGKLAAGQEVEVVSAVANQPWVLVRQGGLATGYVSAGLLRSKDGGMLQAAQTCRLITEEVTTAEAGVSTTRYRACKAPNGAWELTNA